MQSERANRQDVTQAMLGMMALDVFGEYIDENWPSFNGDVRNIDDLTQLFVVTTGLAGEVGELLEHFKKNVRVGAECEGPRSLGDTFDIAKVQEEFGDVLHYLVRLANMYGFDLPRIIDANMEKLDARRTINAAIAKAKAEQMAKDAQSAERRKADQALADIATRAGATVSPNVKPGLAYDWSLNDKDAATVRSLLDGAAWARQVGTNGIKSATESYERWTRSKETCANG